MAVDVDSGAACTPLLGQDLRSRGFQVGLGHVWLPRMGVVVRRKFLVLEVLRLSVDSLEHVALKKNFLVGQRLLFVAYSEV